MLKNQKFKEIIRHFTGKYSLDLDGLNVLVPMFPHEPALFGLLANAARAGNIYVYDPKINLNKYYEPIKEENNLNIKFIGNLTCEILSNVNIVLKSTEIQLLDEKVLSLLREKSVITLFPDNLDFLASQGINLKFCREKRIHAVSLDPEDQKIGLYQYFSHILMKRLYKAGLDIYKSKILLVGSGNFLNTALGYLKSTGAVAYTYNTKSANDQSYVLKHLPELDAIVFMDYPNTEKQLAGSKGIIPVGDIVDSAPEIKVIHISGKIESASLRLGNIKCFPENSESPVINLNIRELGEKGIVETASACLKAAECILKPDKNYLKSEGTIVTYKILNSISPLLSGK